MNLLSTYAEFLKAGGLIPYAAKGLDYLRRAILGSPSETSPVGAPYTPPFLGGQCQVNYYVQMKVQIETATLYQWLKGSARFNDSTAAPSGAGIVGGAISSISFTRASNGWNISVIGASGTVTDSIQDYGQFIGDNPVVNEIRRQDGASDNCGNLPNPNPAPTIGQDGLADSAAPNLLDGASPIITGSPVSPDGSAGLSDDAESDFTDAGALAPSDIAGALVKIASGLLNLVKLLALLNDLLDLLKKLFSKDNKSSFSYDFGNLQGDGFIKLYSEPPDDKVSALFIDLQVTSVRSGIGKVFGNNSPNYYQYEPIGNIRFVSKTFGVLSTHDVSHIRTSLEVPELAYGFFYHFGLDGVNRANCSGFYLKQEE